jgi:hypothetical protein
MCGRETAEKPKFIPADSKVAEEMKLTNTCKRHERHWWPLLLNKLHYSLSFFFYRGLWVKTNQNKVIQQGKEGGGSSSLLHFDKFRSGHLLQCRSRNSFQGFSVFRTAHFT